MEPSKCVLVGVTGSVAAIKVPELVKKLTECQKLKVLAQSHLQVAFTIPSQCLLTVPQSSLTMSPHCSSKFPHYVVHYIFVILQLDVQVVTTKAGLHFFDPKKLPVKCFTDDDEWVRMNIFLHSNFPTSEKSLSPGIPLPWKKICITIVI